MVDSLVKCGLRVVEVRPLAAGVTAVAGIDGSPGVGEAERASSLLGEALSLCRGRRSPTSTYEVFASSEITRLEELRVSAVSERVDAELDLGRHNDLISDLEVLVAQQPVHERLRGQLMLALYRSGRQARRLNGR
jgi:DNA-binding SARP family transcriptional activator